MAVDGKDYIMYLSQMSYGNKLIYLYYWTNKHFLSAIDYETKWKLMLKF